MNKYVSDLHLGHENILKTARPQFECIEKMNEFLIRRWNESVNKDDEVWICGDFSYRSKVDVGHYLKQLKGHKHLIVGNHDVKWMRNCELSDYFESVNHMEVIKDGKKIITLCHYPMMEWFGSRYAEYSPEGTSWLIHGHLHDSRTCDAYYFIRKSLPCALNCGVDINDFHPVTFEELLENNDVFYGRLPSYRTLTYQEEWERSIQNSQMRDYFVDGMK